MGGRRTLCARTAIALSLAAAGCEREPRPSPASAPATTVEPRAVAREATSQWYRAVLRSAEVEVPFFLEVPAPGTAQPCTVANGEERLPADCAWSGEELSVTFLDFGTQIKARRNPDGTLSGTWSTLAIDWGTLEFAARAVPSPDPLLRFPIGGPATADFSGLWRFEFELYGVGEGRFSQAKNGIVSGTIIPSRIGDLRYLSGSASGGKLALSSFDGMRSYLIEAVLAPDGRTMKGTWQFPEAWADPFTATRVDSFDIAEVNQIRLAPGKNRLSVPQLADPDIKGRPLIVEWFGTWCSACIDQTPFLRTLHERYRDQGLTILSIALEGTEDRAYNRQQVERFRKHYGVSWRIDIIDAPLASAGELLPPELLNTGGIPVTAFIRRDGTVRAVHSGFFGPAAPAEHEVLIRQYEDYVRDLLKK